MKGKIMATSLTNSYAKFLRKKKVNEVMMPSQLETKS